MTSIDKAPSKPNAFRRIFFILFGTLVGLEIILRLVSSNSPAFKTWIGNNQNTRLVFSFSGAPPTGMIQKDAAGFRNAQKATEANIVALGDEAVYGSGLEDAKLWTGTLGQMTQQTVYNMGVPQSGPLDYYLLTKQALELKPKQLIVAVHLQDDFFDSFVKGYREEQFKDWRSAEPARVEAIKALDEKTPFEILEKTAKPAKKRKTLLLIQLVNKLLHPNVELPQDKAGEEALHDAYGKVNRDDARIAEGIALTFTAISKVAEAAREAKTEPLILLIPSKVSVFDPSGVPAGMMVEHSKILEQEGFTREKTRDFLKASEIPFIDFYLPFVDAMHGGKKLLNSDANWSNEAHQLIASEIAVWMKERAFRAEHEKVRVGLAKNAARLDASQGLERKLFFGFIFILLVLAIFLTKIGDKARPLFFTVFFGLIVLYQIWNPTDFFPFSSTAFVNTPRQRPVIYRKVTIVLQDGSKLNLPLAQIIPSLGGHRTAFLVKKIIRNPAISDSLATSIAVAYDAKIGGMDSPRIKEVRFEEMKWDFAHDPFDPDKGFVLKRVTGKPVQEVAHA